MWGRQLGVSEGDTKLHYFVANKSLCNTVEITSDDYVQYNGTPAQESKCGKCLSQIIKPPVY